MKRKKAETKTVVEKYMLTHPGWTEGYRSFNRLFGKPLGWMFLLTDGKGKLIRLDQKGHCSFYAGAVSNETSCSGFLTKYFEQLKDQPDKSENLPNPYKCAFGRRGVVFSIDYLHQLKGYLVLCAIGKLNRNIQELIPLFSHFLKAQTELAYRHFELQNFYETVHPRALALSTMHSVHRVISSSLHLNELLPRIGRLCAQVLKARGSDIFLIEEDKNYLVPKFSLADKKGKIRKSRIRIGRGIEGRVAETAEFYFSKSCISIPFIEEDVIGVISLRDKMTGGAFARVDMEILKTLSEQAVVAIKNAKLFEETEKLTVSSIEAINEMLELSQGGSHLQLSLFSELAFEIGKELHLSGMDLTNLYRAGFLIDAGHVGTPDKILTKKSGLTKREFQQIKKHPYLGASVLRKMGSLAPVIPIVLHHHERYDGTGYPDGLKGNEIPVAVGIVVLVDAFIAMLSKRPYRQPKRVNEAIAEIKRNSGSQFDPRIVDAFLKVVTKTELLQKCRRFEKQVSRPKRNGSVRPFAGTGK